MRMTIEKKVHDWWYDLDDRTKEEIIDDVMPDDIIYDLDEAWELLDWEIQLELWKENNL